MRAPDVCERWKWKPGEEIIERLLSMSSRSRLIPVIGQVQPPPRDRYYFAARRAAAKTAAKADAILNAVRNSL